MKRDGYKGNRLVQLFASLDENYVLRAFIFAFPNFDNDDEFLKFVKQNLINNNYSDRHEMLERHQNIFKTGGKNCVLDYYNGKDLKAKKPSLTLIQ